MFCNKCGSKNPDDASFCHKCGVALWAETSPTPIVTEPHQLSRSQGIATAETPKTASGVGGALLLFCIGMFAITPLLRIKTGIDVWTATSANFSQVAGLKNAVVVTQMIAMFVTLLGMYAGYLLWSVKPGAVAFAKAALVTFLVGEGLSVAAFYTMISWPDGVAPDSEFIKGIILALVFFGVWFPYLLFSKRVRATYGSSGFKKWAENTGISGADVFNWSLGLLFFCVIVYSNLKI